MGFSYGRTASGRSTLSCDSCGTVGGVRKRTCPHKVHYAGGGSLPYCYPAALCSACYATAKPTLHAGHAELAAARTAAESAKHARLVAGDKEVSTAFGSWHAKVPTGFVGVGFAGPATERGMLNGSISEWRLVPAEVYDPSVRRYLSDYHGALPWSGPHA